MLVETQPYPSLSREALSLTRNTVGNPRDMQTIAFISTNILSLTGQCSFTIVLFAIDYCFLIFESLNRK
jgi:hypothetical protein